MMGVLVRIDLAVVQRRQSIADVVELRCTHDVFRPATTRSFCRFLRKDRVSVRDEARDGVESLLQSPVDR